MPAANTLRHARARRGFSLIELLVVIGIIALLIAIVVAVGATVTSGAKQRATLDTIRVLDSSIDSYVASTGAIPRAWIDNPHVADTVLPVADAVLGAGLSGDPTLTADSPDRPRLINSVGFYLQQAAQVESANAAIQAIDDKLVAVRSTTDPVGAGDGMNNVGEPGIPTVLDGWGRPIRYVHPAFDGIIEANGRSANTLAGAVSPVPLLPSVAASQLPGGGSFRLRRNRIMPEEFIELGGQIATGQRDSDGGQCPGDRPYFYSAGPDGDPATTDNNVYSTTPNFVQPY
jgi:prepilin-type N-terminal cleavage/methylation domain-containing protein